MRDFLKKISKKIVVAIGVLAIAVSSFIGTNNSYTANAARTYTGVLEDLQRDESFSQENYPTLESVSKSDDKLQLIALAESIDKELFDYFYCPLVNKMIITANKMQMRFSISGDSYYLKNLEFINAQSTLFKFKVLNYQVTGDKTRIYYVKYVYYEENPESTGVLVDKSWTFISEGNNYSGSVSSGKYINIGVLGVNLPTTEIESDNKTSANAAKNIKVVFAVLGILSLVGGVTYLIMYFAKGNKVKIKMPKFFKKLKFSFSKKKK